MIGEESSSVRTFARNDNFLRANPNEDIIYG